MLPLACGTIIVTSQGKGDWDSFRLLRVGLEQKKGRYHHTQPKGQRISEIWNFIVKMGWERS